MTAVLRSGLNSGSLALVKGCYRLSDPAKLKPKVEKEKPPMTPKKSKTPNKSKKVFKKGGGGKGKSTR